MTLKFKIVVYFYIKTSYIAASPDGIANCKLQIEIKCPFNVRNKTIQEGIH